MNGGAAIVQSILLLLAGGLAMLVSGVAWSRRPSPGAAALAALNVCLGVWCGGYALEIGSTEAITKEAWAAIQYFGIVGVPPLWFAVGVLTLDKRRQAHPRLLWAGLAVVPLVSLLLVLTNARHGLMWLQVQSPHDGAGPLRLVHGAWFWVMSGYGHLLVLAGTILLLLGARRRPGARRLLLLGAVAPWIGNITYLSDPSWLFSLDPTPFGFATAAVALWASIRNHALLDLRPLARSHVFESMQDAAIVLDTEGRVADVNLATEELTGMRAEDVLGRQPHVLGGPVWAAIAETLDVEHRVDDGPATSPIRIETGAAIVYLDVRVSVLPTRAKHEPARLVVARNSSRLRQALEAYRESAAFSDRIVSNAPLGIAVFDDSRRVLVWNPFMESRTGLAAPKMLGRDANRALPFFREAGLEALLTRALGGETVTSGSVPFAVEESGRGGWTVSTFSPTRGPEGEVTGALLLFEDVSRRHRIESELEGLKDELERHAETLAAILPVGVFRTDPGGRCTYVNQRWCEISGIVASEALRQGWTAAIHPDDLGRVDAAWSEAVRAESSFRAEHRFVRNGSTFTWVIALAVPERDARGNVVGYVGVLSDISEHRRLEESLRASEAKLREVTDAVPGAVFSFQTDAAGKRSFVFASRGAESLFGLRSEDLDSLLDPATTSIVAEDFERLVVEMGSAFRERRRLTSEFRLRRDPGLPARWVRCRAGAGVNASGGWELIGVAWDVTDEKLSEERLMLLSRALEATADMVTITDSDWRFEFVNAAFERETGYQLDEIRGRRIGELIGGGEQPELVAQLGQTVGSGLPFHGVFINRRRDGSTYHEEKTITPVLDDNSTVRHFVATGRDISRRLAMERDLRRGETMAAMGRLVAGVAHEVRNPLFAISALLDAFEQDLGDDEGFQAYGLRLRREVARMSELMRDLLVYGRPTVAAKKCSLASVLDEARRACETIANQSDVALDIDATDGIPELLLDKARMRQVFENLFQNAIEHSPRRSRVTVRCTGQGNNIECVVSDGGPGFRQQDLPHLFEPFFTRRRGGTGLGLAIVQRIVEEHGGQVWAANRSTGGAELTVVLPIHREV